VLVYGWLTVILLWGCNWLLFGLLAYASWGEYWQMVL
jgi:hypothetical protein